MFNNLKETITDLAKSAVVMAEDTLQTASGQEKKSAAIEYITSMLPIPTPFKSIVTMLLSKFIDEAVEHAVLIMNKKTED